MVKHPAWRVFAWRWFRLGVAAALLWYDLRLFLLYAFVTILRTWESVEHVRATARVFQITDDLRWAVLFRKSGVTNQDVSEVVDEVREAQSFSELENIARDWSAAIGRPVSADELFDTASAIPGSLLPKDEDDRIVREKLREIARAL